MEMRVDHCGPMKIQKNRSFILAFLGGFIIFGTANSADTGAPASERHPVTDVYHGVAVADPYRWLENTADAKVHAWSAAQDARSRKYLDSLPQRAPIFQQLLSQISATSSSYAGLHAVGDVVFAYYTQPPKQ